MQDRRLPAGSRRNKPRQGPSYSLRIGISTHSSPLTKWVARAGRDFEGRIGQKASFHACPALSPTADKRNLEHLMNEPKPNQLKHLSDRVTGLEEMLTHFERTLGQLDEVLQQIQTRMDGLEQRLENLTRNAEQSTISPAAELSAEDERPPHY